MLGPSANKFYEWQIPTEHSSPSGIYVDSDDNVWFTEFEKGKVACLNTAGEMVPEFPANTLVLLLVASTVLLMSRNKTSLKRETKASED